MLFTPSGPRTGRLGTEGQAGFAHTVGQLGSLGREGLLEIFSFSESMPQKDVEGI